MNLSLYRSTHVLLARRRLQHFWEEWSFQPIAETRTVSTEGLIHLITASVEVHVHVPIGSQLVTTQLAGRRPPIEERLRTYSEPYGYTAETVWYLIGIGARDFGLELALPPDFDAPPVDPEGPEEEPTVKVRELWHALNRVGRMEESFSLNFRQEERTKGGRRNGSAD